MSTERKGVEFFVGLFLLLGLGIIAAMVLIFGRFSQGMQKYYTLRVVFPNASGVVKGCDVLISGARVGVVAQAPMLTGDSYEVAVVLHINEAFQIPRTSNFQIRSNGMLGDSYIDIVPPLKYSAADFAVPDEIIPGRKVSGFDELTSKGSELVDKLNTEILAKLSENLDEIKLATSNLNTRLLSDKNLANVEDTFANFSKTSKDLDIVMAKAGEAIDSVKLTMRTADSSAAELKLALGELREMADTASRTIDSTKVLINKASSGEGTFGALVSDKQMAQDLRALIANLRRSGVLFYKDRPLPPAPATPAPATPGPKKRR